jgi:hypothetical protein
VAITAADAQRFGDSDSSGYQQLIEALVGLGCVVKVHAIKRLYWDSAVLFDEAVYTPLLNLLKAIDPRHTITLVDALHQRTDPDSQPPSSTSLEHRVHLLINCLQRTRRKHLNPQSAAKPHAEHVPPAWNYAIDRVTDSLGTSFAAPGRSRRRPHSAAMLVMVPTLVASTFGARWMPAAVEDALRSQDEREGSEEQSASGGD